MDKQTGSEVLQLCVLRSCFQYLFPLLYQVSILPSLNLFSRVPFSALTMTSVTSDGDDELLVEVAEVMAELLVEVMAVVIPADTRLTLDSRESAELNSKVVFIS